MMKHDVTSAEARQKLEDAKDGLVKKVEEAEQRLVRIKERGEKEIAEARRLYNIAHLPFHLHHDDAIATVEGDAFVFSGETSCFGCTNVESVYTGNYGGDRYLPDFVANLRTSLEMRGVKKLVSRSRVAPEKSLDVSLPFDLLLKEAFRLGMIDEDDVRATRTKSRRESVLHRLNNRCCWRPMIPGLWEHEPLKKVVTPEDAVDLSKTEGVFTNPDGTTTSIKGDVPLALLKGILF